MQPYSENIQSGISNIMKRKTVDAGLSFHRCNMIIHVKAVQRGVKPLRDYNT